MIIRLQPEQIADYWDIIKHAACQTNNISTEVAEEYSNNLFQLLLMERYQAWAGFDVLEDGSKRFIGVLITAIFYDELAARRSLHLYGIYAFRAVDDSMLKEGLSAVLQFAKSEHCYQIFGFTNNERLLRFLEENNFLVDIKRFALEV